MKTLRSVGLGRKLCCALLALCLAGCSQKATSAKYFTKNVAERALETAINQDDPQAVINAIAQGADVNTVGKSKVTPLLLSVGRIKIKATKALLEQGANSQARSVSGENAMTVAVESYHKYPELLEMLLDHGGDPSTRRSDDDPIITQFLTGINFEAVRYLTGKGADINARDRSDRPLVVSYALSGDWDAVWTLLELGADYNYAGESLTVEGLLNDPDQHDPDSPLWPYKIRVWKFLKGNGVDVRQNINDLVDPSYREYLVEKGLPKPDLEAEFKAWSEKNP